MAERCGQKGAAKADQTKPQEVGQQLASWKILNLDRFMTIRLAKEGDRTEKFVIAPKDLFYKFISYTVIGGGAFLADYTVFIILFFVSGNPYISNVFGICTGMTVSFSLNRKYNFRKIDLLGQRAARFVAVATLGVVVSTLIIMLLIGQNLDARIAKVIAMLFVFLMQFLLNAFWTFR